MRLIFLVVLVLSALPGLAAAECSELLDREFRPLAGKKAESLCGYQGQVLLIVNTASKCGLTPQYEGLEALHERLHPRGFTVLGFPSNDFLGQEPGTEDQIREFCTLTYGVKFPMFQKTRVKGDTADPFYKRLAQQTGQAPGWNFHKYLINRKGEVVASFGSRTPPDNEELLAKIEALLAEPAADTSADASQ
jgi:glutathione peroxidase